MRSKSKGFSSGALLKIPPSSPYMEEFGLDIQKSIRLKQVKIYISKNNKNTKKFRFPRQLQVWGDSVCFTGYSLQHQSKYWSAETKWNLNKETSNKSWGLNNFLDSMQYIFFNRYQVFHNFRKNELWENLVV